jgi:hypothetical protein
LLLLSLVCFCFCLYVYVFSSRARFVIDLRAVKFTLNKFGLN